MKLRNLPLLLGAVCVLLLAQTPQSPCITKVQQLVEKQKLSQALQQLQPCSTSADEQQLKGRIFLMMYQADSALVYLQKAYDAGKTDDSTTIQFIQALLWNKQLPYIGDLLQTITDTSLTAYKLVAAQHLQMKNKLDDAILLYSEIIEQNPDYFEVILQKATLLSWQKKYADASDLLQHVASDTAAKSTVRSQALLKRAEIASWQKKLDLAHEILDTLAIFNPHYVQGMLLRGTLFEWQGEFFRAKQIYSDILEIDNGNEEAQLRIGKLLWVK